MSKLEFYTVLLVLIVLVVGGFVFVGMVDKFAQELTILIVGK